MRIVETFNVPLPKAMLRVRINGLKMAMWRMRLCAWLVVLAAKVGGPNVGAEVILDVIAHRQVNGDGGSDG